MDTNTIEAECSSTKRFQCEYCPNSKTFVHKHSLEQHILNQHGKDKLKIKPLHCSLCLKNNQIGRYFSKKYLLNAHIKEAHGQRRCKCDICFKTFTFPSKLRKHQRIHSATNIIVDRKRYKCDFCSKFFGDKYKLNSHLFYKHQQKLEGVKYFKCDCCEKEFLHVSHLEGHVVAKHVVDKEFECDVCLKSFMDQETLDKHVKEHGRRSKPFFEAKEKTQFFKCEHCSKTFDCEVYFNVHRRIVHSYMKWKCDFEQCTKSFKHYSRLQGHKLTHSNLKTYVCPTCPKSFKLPGTFKVHLKTHLDEKAFKCKMCPKSFVTLAARRIHISNKHGGPKPFKCPVPNCDLRFTNNSYLKSHLISHETNTFFKCDICTETTKKFKSLLSLRQHLRFVHTDAIKTSSLITNQVVFTCTSKECSLFKTRSDKEIAVHYNEQHGLPKVLLFQNIVKIECATSSGGSLLSFTEEIPNCETNRLILKRYKCKFCLTFFISISLFKKHRGKCSAKSSFKCVRCSKTFRYINGLNKHVREKHEKDK